MPQIVGGAGWKTTITVMNFDAAPSGYTISFYDENGAALTMDLVGRPRTSRITGTLAANGSVVIQTANTSANQQQGWARVEATRTAHIGGMAVFGYTDAAGITREAVVPISSWADDDAYMPFDNTAGFATAVAICNPNDFGLPVTVTAAFFDESGNRITLDQFTLRPGHPIAVMTPEGWPQTAGKRGMIHFTTPNLYLSILGLRASPGGGLTSVHTLSPL